MKKSGQSEIKSEDPNWFLYVARLLPPFALTRRLDGGACHPPERIIRHVWEQVMGSYDPDETPQVLVVEDDELLRMTAADLVSDEHLTVFEADGADQALQLLRCHSQIGIVFTDIQMPGSMDGLALAHHSKQRWPHLQHIIVSGQLTPAMADMPEGARFFGKPYRTSLVRKALRVMAGMACDDDRY